MSPRASTLPERRSAPRKPRLQKKKTRSAWSIWWPVLLGIAVTPLTIRAAAVLALEGPTALRTLYPFVELVKLRALGLPEEFANNLSQLMMYAQFPLYGLFMSLVNRFSNAFTALVQTFALHLLAVGFLIAIARM